MAAQFIISAASPEQFPAEADPEIAFLGRSNVGKSSLLNALLQGNKAAGNKGGASDTARVSSWPGRTQTINFYQVDGGFRFVDLPGYGYAKVPLEVSKQWKVLIEQYLVGRDALKLAVLLVDSRRGWTPKDVELREWLEHQRQPFVVVVTKVDKLKSHKERHHSQSALREGYSGEMLESSAATGRGVREIWQAIKNLKTT
ncbi:MAG: ribosome biogenesis GTP-binding protein YihA/YsxC [Acidobacteriota bacterium]